MATRHCGRTPSARRRRRKFSPTRGEAKLLQNQRLERRTVRRTSEPHKQQAHMAELCVVDHLHLKYLSPRSTPLRRQKFFRRIMLGRSWSERSCATTRTKNVIPSADRMCSSSSPSRWTPLPCPSTKPSSRTGLRPLSSRWDPVATSSARVGKKYDVMHWPLQPFHVEIIVTTKLYTTPHCHSRWRCASSRPPPHKNSR